MIHIPAEHTYVHYWFQVIGFAGQKSSSNLFGVISIEQTLEETINRDTQIADGTNSFSLPSVVVHKYYLTSEYRTTFLGNAREIIGLGSSECHHQKSWIRATPVDVMHQNNCINPFDRDVNDIIGLVTSVAQPLLLYITLVRRHMKNSH